MILFIPPLKLNSPHTEAEVGSHAETTSLKTLLSDEKNIEVWTFMAPTFPKDFVDFVNEKIKEGKVYSRKENL